MEKQLAETKVLQARADALKIEQTKREAEAQAALDDKNKAEEELKQAQAKI